MSGPRLIPRQPDNAAHSPPSRNLRDEGISRAKPLASWPAGRLAGLARHPAFANDYSMYINALDGIAGAKRLHA
jgi:hypothetical protein